MGMLKSGHGLLRQAFLVLTILVLMISLLSVGMVQAPKRTFTHSISITGLVTTLDPDKMEPGAMLAEGNRQGTSFSGGTAWLDLTAPLELSHYSLVDKGDFTLNGVEYTMGDSGFGRDTLILRFNIYHPEKYWNGAEPEKGDYREVFRLRIYLDTGGEKGPGCYEDWEARVEQVHTVWEWQERGRSGRNSGWVLIDEDHARSISQWGHIVVDIDEKCPK